MLGVAQEALGPERVRHIVLEHGIAFPVLVDRESRLARELGFAVVPAGFLVEDGILRYVQIDDFDIADPRVRRIVGGFLAGEAVPEHPPRERGDRRALELFATGVESYAGGEAEDAVRLWRSALAIDPDNFLIRSQIWVLEHPEHFYPAVDREWQQTQLAQEGYERPLP
jgi:hypothetical protein